MLQMCKTKKKSQITTQHVFYTLLVIIFFFVLLLGYALVEDIGKKGEKATFIFLKMKLANDVEDISRGGVRIEKYKVPTGVNKICFSEPKTVNPLTCEGCSSANEYPILANAISDKTKENVFLIGSFISEAMEIEGITIGCCEFLCINATQSEVKLWLEGQGKKTLIKRT